MEERLSNNFNSKLDRIERALAAIGPGDDTPQPRPAAQPPPPKRLCQPSATITHQSQVQNPPSTTQNFIPTSHNLIDTQPILHNRAENSGKDGEPSQMPHVTSLQLALTSDPQVPDYTSAQNVNKLETSWIIGQAIAAPQSQHLPPPPLPTSANELNHDDDIQARVSHILASTADHLSANSNSGKMAFPHKFVQRGPDRRHPAFNTLSLSEHCFGIFMMIRDHRISSSVKPLLYNHIQEIMEDACSFDWPTAVRPWSEEVFSQVAQGRLSWASTPAIQMLRMSMARACTAKIIHNDAPARPAVAASSQNFNQNRQRFHQGNPNDIFRGGPPCDNCNTPNGCNLPSGHIIRGKRMIHVCKYCLFHTSASNQHSEVHCNNKARFSNNHF